MIEGGTYVVRPDGHVGLALVQPDAAVITDYARRHGLLGRRVNAARGGQSAR